MKPFCCKAIAGFMFYLIFGQGYAAMTRDLNITVRAVFDPPRHQGIGFQAQPVGLTNVELVWNEKLSTFDPVQLRYRVISDGPLSMTYRLIINSLYLSCAQEGGVVTFDSIKSNGFQNVIVDTEKSGRQEIVTVGRSYVANMDYSTWSPAFGEDTSVGEGVFTIRFPALGKVYQSGGGKCFGGFVVGLSAHDL